LGIAAGRWGGQLAGLDEKFFRTAEKNDHCTKAGKEVLILSYL